MPIFFDIILLADYGAAMKTTDNQTITAAPSLGRVLGAILYDGLVLLALFMAAGFAVVPILGHPPETNFEIWLLRAILLGISYGFFCWFWTHGGQTVGMRAWKIKLVGKNGEPVSWPTASSRFLLAILSWLILGTGYLWILFNSENQSLHDHFSKTRLLHIPKEK